MSGHLSRRRIFQMAGLAASASLGARYATAQQAAEPPKPAAPKGGGNQRMTGHPDPFPGLATRSTVSLVKGEDRRKNVYNSLVAIDEQIRPRLKNKKYVIIKPNNVTTTNQLGATHADALRGILDYLDGRFKGPIIIAESSAGDTMSGFENFKYPAVVAEYKKQKVSLLDFNLDVVPVRLAARLLDPDAFVFGSAIMKTHNVAIVTLSIKNMVVGAPLHNSPKETIRWNDKRRYHAGIRQSNYNFFLTAQFLSKNWGATIIDGFEGMEGNGPSSGTPVPHRVCLASTDYVAADRVGAELMGVDPSWLGWLKYSGDVGIGQSDISKIDIRGNTTVAAEVRKYRMHGDIERQLQWRGPMEELPVNLGWTRPVDWEHHHA